MKKLRKIALAVATVLAVSQAAPVLADTQYTFSDIGAEKYSWAAGYIEEMAELGFISGYEDGTYKPDNSVTRLEVLSLFARAMGSNSDANADALKKAEEQYMEVVEGYDLNFGQKDIAYLLYRGALKEAELDTYLKGELKSQPMPRYEAAIIITKAMCAEKKATSEIMVDLAYTDAKEIPAKASQYVYYVTEKEIMAGMGDGTFSPASEVLRSQIAVMLSKTVGLMNLTVETLKIANIDDANVMFYDENGEVAQMGYNSNTRFYVEGELTQAKNVPSSVEAEFTYVDGELAYVDVENAIPDETIKGVFQSFASSNGVVTVSVKADDEIKEYVFSEDVIVTFQEQEATIRDFEKGDYVIIELSLGKIIELKGEPKTKTISNATVEIASVVEDGTITISHALEEYNGLKLEVASDVVVRKNGANKTLADVYKGDTVTLTLEYNIITEIQAKSATTTVEGTIKSMELSSSPKVTVTVKGEEVTYDLTTDMTVFVNDKQGTIYDLRVGDIIKITLESKAVKKIVATTTQGQSYSRTGVVTKINKDYGFIKISYNDDGVTYEETVYFKASTRFITSEGTTKAMKDVKEGDIVSVRGAVTNGAFEANLIIIELG